MTKKVFSPIKALFALGFISATCAGFIAPAVFAEQSTSSSSTGTVIAIPPDTGGPTDEVVNTTTTYADNEYKVCVNHYTEKIYYVQANEACASGYQAGERTDGLYIFDIPNNDPGYVVCINQTPAEILEGMISVGIYQQPHDCSSGAGNTNSRQIYLPEETFKNNFTDCLLSAYNLEHDTEVKYDLSEEQLADIKNVYCNIDVVYVHSLDEMTNLEELELSNIVNESLDFSHNTKLTGVSVRNSLNFKDINVAQNSALENLEIRNSSVKEIDVSKNTELAYLGVSSTDISEIDISKNTKITTLDLSYNELSEIDLSNNTELNTLFIGDNNLEKLDLSKNTKLAAIYADNNKLTEVNFGDAGVGYADLRNNNLEYIDLSNLTEKSYVESASARLSGNKNLKIVAVPKSWEGKYTEDKIRERLGLDEDQKDVIIQYGPLKVPNTGAAAIFETAKYAAIVALPIILALTVISKKAIKIQRSKVKFSR